MRTNDGEHAATKVNNSRFDKEQSDPDTHTERLMTQQMQRVMLILEKRRHLQRVLHSLVICDQTLSRPSAPSTRSSGA